MKHHVCITIGINQYQFLQPLSYAQQDAERLQDCLIKQVGFSADQSLLMSDTSPHVWGIPTYPDRENILDWVEGVCQEQLQPEDILWFFFSGYGMSYDRRDYLLPIDGNPGNIEATGIAVELIYERLKQAPAQTVIALLDINRSQGARAGKIPGLEVIKLAQALEIPTFLSCRSDQLSRETSALRHGFFTAALIDALQTGEHRTIQMLNQFLSRRLPALTEEHLRPQQDPVLIVQPQHQIAQIIPPQSSPSLVGVAQQNGNKLMSETSQTNSNGLTPESTSVSQFSTSDHQKGQDEPQTQSSSTQRNLNSVNQSQSNNLTPPPDPSKDSHTEAIMSDRSFIQQLALWSGATALLLLLGVFYTNRPAFLGQKSIDTGLVTPTEITASPEATSPAELPEATTETDNTEEQNKASEAPETSSPEPSQTLLTQAKIQLQDASASSFSNAITEARQIPQDNPAYPQAQQEIERWSQTILDIAEGRSQANDFQGAIAAAMLVPDANSTLYEQAQLQIQKWDQQRQQFKINQALLKVAQGRIKKGQASSYSDAIGEARKIKLGQPGYEEAQTLINQWSAEILELAQARAKKKQLTNAVEAASLVPKESDSYNTAQEAIAEWNTKLESQKKP